MYFALLSIILFIQLANAGTYQDSNRFIDTAVVNYLPAEIANNNQDPYSMPDFQTQFKDKIKFITVKVKTDFSAGEISGLSNVKRAFDCSPTYRETGEDRLNCTLEFEDLGLKYDGKSKYGKLPKITFHVASKSEKVHVALVVASHENGRFPYVRDLILTKNMSVNPEFTGLGPANGILEGLTSSFKKSAERDVTNVLNNEFRNTLDRVLKKLTLPL